MITDERIAKFIDTCRAMGDAGDGARYDWWDNLAAALTELQSLRSKPVAGVEVKPLEWEQGEARSVIGLFSVHRYEAPSVKWSVRLNGTALQLYAETESGAHALAQQHLSEAILSALLPKAAAPVVSEPVAWPPLVDLGRVLGFFASCIKSGENWTSTCQAEYEKANAALQALYAASPQPQPKASTYSEQEPVAYGVYLNDGRFMCIAEMTEGDAVTQAESFYETGAYHIRPLYASPQPSAVITEEMVERAHAAYAKTVGGTLDGQPMRNALAAAMKETSSG